MAPELVDPPSRPPRSLPARLSAEGKDRALDAALQRVTAGAVAALDVETAEPAGHEQRVTAARRLPALPARYAPYPEGLDARLRAALSARGISELYTHQAEAIGHASAGRHVVVTTPTASGKTLCYNVPVLDAILKDSSSRALYLFPTKALAQDQLAELHALSGGIERGCGTGHRRAHLRRRHAAGRAACDPRPGAHRPQQSGHAAFGDPAAPPEVGEALREPPVRRD